MKRDVPVTGGDLEGLIQKAVKYGTVEIRPSGYADRVEVIIHRGQRTLMAVPYGEPDSVVTGWGESVSEALQHVFRSNFLESIPRPKPPVR